MRKLGILAIFLVFCLGAAPVCRDENGLRTKARAATQDFMQALKEHLLEAIKGGGPAHAISVCSEVAPGIASRLSRENGWQVGRTSLRLRNTVNLPEPWEQEVLERFAAAHGQGVEAKDLEYCVVAEVDGQHRFRYMRAIPTQEICLLCHGKKLHPDVRQQLARDYPHDQAIGFSVGEIRGAFTIEIPLVRNGESLSQRGF